MRKRTTLIRQARLTAPAAVAGIFILGGSGFAQAPSPDFAHFTYDRSASLNVKQVSVRVQDGVTIEDITYTGANGDTVPAYLVIPKGVGKFAGIIWGHWLLDGAANANRTEFLDEAIALARIAAAAMRVGKIEEAETALNEQAHLIERLKAMR